MHFIRSTIFPWIRFENKPVLIRNYPCKYPQSGINKQIPLTPRSRLCNRLRWFVTEVLKIINMWYHQIIRSQDLLHKVHQCKYNNVFSKLVYYLWSGCLLYLFFYDLVSITMNYLCILTPENTYKVYQQSNTLNSTFMFMQQTKMVGSSSSEAHKHVIP